MAADVRRRRAMSLLEIVIATSMLAMMLTAISIVLRTGRQAWAAQEASLQRVEAAQATLRHIVRQVRQADAVAGLNAATDGSGSLSLAMSDGSVASWAHDAASNSVNFGVPDAVNLLASDITGLRVTGYAADGVTVTTDPGQIRSLRIDVTVNLPSVGSKVFSSWAWIRSW